MGVQWFETWKGRVYGKKKNLALAGIISHRHKRGFWKVVFWGEKKGEKKKRVETTLKSLRGGPC